MSATSAGVRRFANRDQWQLPFRIAAVSLLLCAPLDLARLGVGQALLQPPLVVGMTALSLCGYAALAGAGAAATAALDGSVGAWWQRGDARAVYAALCALPPFYLLNFLLFARFQGSEALLRAPEPGAVPPTLYYAMSAMWYAGVALQEETVFRGAVQALVRRRLPPGPGWSFVAIFSASLPWAFIHAGNGSPWWFYVGTVQLNGLVYGALRQQFGLRASVLCHASYNVLNFATAVWLGSHG